MSGCPGSPKAPPPAAATASSATAAVTPATTPAAAPAAPTAAPTPAAGTGEPGAPAARPAWREVAEPNARFQLLYAEYEARAAPLARANDLAWWDAALSGKAEDFNRSAALEKELRTLHADREVYAELTRLKAGGGVTDPLLARVLDVLLLDFQENQVDPALMRTLVDEGKRLEQIFNTFRATLDGRPATANDLRTILATSDDSARRRQAWDASKQVGALIAPSLRELVRKRNEAAKSLGFSNYYEMQLRLGEQDPARIAALFEEVDRATAAPFAAMKAKLDGRLARRFAIPATELRPWHYGEVFFQESPGVEGLDLDRAFAPLDPQAVATRFYTSLGLPVAEILARSDLFERPGKVEHAFCTHIDRQGDVRVLANLRNDERWTGTLLHELGHGVYDAAIDRRLPWILRTPAHAFTTEGVAELFGTLTRDPEWLAEYTSLPPATREQLAALAREDNLQDQLIFARWSLVMVNFERRLYLDPEANLAEVWWELVSRYQGLQPPERVSERHDWATKIHVVTVPAYYHNYLLGRMFAAQLRQRIGQQLPATMATGRLRLAGHPAVGQFLTEQVFVPGLRLPWDELVKQATGEPLSPHAFVAAL